MLSARLCVNALFNQEFWSFENIKIGLLERSQSQGDATHTKNLNEHQDSEGGVIHPLGNTKSKGLRIRFENGTHEVLK